MLQFLISALALLVITITMFLRAYDLKDGGLRWNIRRVGFILAGFSPLVIALGELRQHDYPDWIHTSFRLGLALVFMTTPMGVPWHKWVWKDLSEIQRGWNAQKVESNPVVRLLVVIAIVIALLYFGSNA